MRAPFTKLWAKPERCSLRSTRPDKPFSLSSMRSASPASVPSTRLMMSSSSPEEASVPSAFTVNMEEITPLSPSTSTATPSALLMES